MINMFTPADGERSRIQHCYDIVVSHEAGDVIPVELVMEACGCDRPAAIRAMWATKPRLERDKRNSVEIVQPGNGPAYGWRVLDRSTRNLDEIDERFKKSRRAQTRVTRLINNTDRDRLDQISRMRYDRQQANALRAAGLYDRKPVSLTELARKAEEQRHKQLPPGRPPGEEPGAS